jgi:antitoxin (DNA-binding transcriptional repressor) of toxin-antitoxin stability system
MQISIRELKANPAKAIDLVRQGQRVQVTSHRKVVAELVPPLPQAGPARAASEAEADRLAIERLIAAGVIAEPATKPFKLPKPVRLAPSPDGQTMSDLVIEGRGPR